MAKREKITQEDYLRGLDQVEYALHDFVSELESTSAEGLATAALFVASEAQQRAPLDTGDLRGSVFVDLDGDQYAIGAEDGGGVNITGAVPEKVTEALIGFNTPYAAEQHEHTEYNHPRGGQEKYLESVLVENQDRLLALIAGKFFGGGDDA